MTMTSTPSPTVPAVLQIMEDDPSSPGWWRYGLPHAVRATAQDLEHWTRCSEFRFYTCSSMTQARRWCGEDRAAWRADHG
jgi:hypothetical protein